MNRSLIFILTSFVYFKCGSRGNENPNDKLDVKEFFNYLKFLPDPMLFPNPEVLKIDLHEYRFGLLNEDIHLNISQLIRKYGYNAEEHIVKTEDGYILTIVRIRRKGPAVFLMHGLMMSADDWITAGPESGIGYLLAEEGYDVWIGNARGNKHSRRHELLHPSNPAFWNFSFDEIGRYDLPAMIDYVLDNTNQTQLLYAGHSQGVTSAIIMCSELLEYNDKLSLIVALSAPTAIPNIKSPFLNFLKYMTFFRPEMLFALVKEIGLYEFLPRNELVDTFRLNICGTIDLAKTICSNVVFLICGFNPAQLNITQLPVIYSHTPAGAATKQIEHYSQSVISGKFRRFDYGELRNLELYGTSEPPAYKLEDITAPIALFYSDNDWLVSVEDTEALRRRLNSVVDYYRVPLDEFNHADYMYAKDLKSLIFEKMLSLLKQYESK